MANFAEIDSNNIVQRVVVVNNLDCFDVEKKCECDKMGEDYCKSLYGENTRWLRTSYNGNIRFNHACPGFTYDEQLDAFIPPKPFDSWVLNTSNCQWESPIPEPEPSEEYIYYWDEDLYQSDNTKGWVIVTE
jgi:hypothetical protein